MRITRQDIIKIALDFRELLRANKIGMTSEVQENYGNFIFNEETKNHIIIGGETDRMLPLFIVQYKDSRCIETTPIELFITTYNYSVVRVATYDILDGYSSLNTKDVYGNSIQERLLNAGLTPCLDELERLSQLE